MDAGIEALLLTISSYGTSFVISAVVIYVAYWYITKEYPLRREENKSRFIKLEDAVKNIAEEVALTRQAIEGANRVIEKNTDAYEKMTYESQRLNDKVAELGASIKEGERRSESMVVLLEKIGARV